MPPTCLGSGIDKDRADYTVFCGEWNIGRIYEVRGGPEHLRWLWALRAAGLSEILNTRLSAPQSYRSLRCTLPAPWTVLT
jgi:hypothetical protein